MNMMIKTRNIGFFTFLLILSFFVQNLGAQSNVKKKTSAVDMKTDYMQNRLMQHELLKKERETLDLTIEKIKNDTSLTKEERKIKIDKLQQDFVNRRKEQSESWRKNHKHKVQEVRKEEIKDRKEIRQVILEKKENIKKRKTDSIKR